jgi:hypothetical protein
MRRLSIVLLTVALAWPAAAQPPQGGSGSPAQPSSGSEAGQLPADHPPVGPAEARKRIKKEQKKQQRKKMAPSQGGSGSPGRMPSDHPKVDRRAVQRAMGKGPPLTEAKASSDVDSGSIRVKVVTGEGEPVQGAVVKLGILGQGGKREHKSGKTDAEGLYTFRGLKSGSQQAYRVSVPYKGAEYGASPFRLPGNRGYRVKIRRLPVTQRDRALLLHLGRTMLEIKKGRLHVVQQYRLMNLAEKTYVFPDEGMLHRLPEDFTGFQAQETMSDQSLKRDDEGFRIHGSVPPGPVKLTWAYDLPLEGSTMSFGYRVPWRTYQYQVMASASKDMELEVQGMPEPEPHEHDGGRMLITQMQRRPGDAQFDHVQITVRGIPGPGPLRWVAFGGMLVLMVAGGMLVFRGGNGAQVAQARAQRKQEVLDEAAELERMHAAGEIGPRYRQQRLDELITELASLLRQDAASKQ